MTVKTETASAAGSEDKTSASASALSTIAIEMKGLADVSAAFDTTDLRASFDEAAAKIVQAAGRVVVTGMGKSGHIGRKIAATLSSTGTPSLFLHPAEASHGDMGMITINDVVLALSWSGETAELGDILNYCRRFKVPLIAITSRNDSALGRQANICITLPRVQEACPNRLAPTSSTTIQLAIGDALAVALIEQRGFSSEDFRIFHPGGKLGSQLVTVADLMGSGESLPRVTGYATIMSATVEMTQKRYGITAVVDDDGHLIGAFTDGDLRRSVAAGDVEAQVHKHMTLRPVRVAPTILASEALAIMNDANISQVFVCEGDRLIGVLHIHDILHVGVV